MNSLKKEYIKTNNGHTEFCSLCNYSSLNGFLNTKMNVINTTWLNLVKHKFHAQLSVLDLAFICQ